VAAGGNPFIGQDSLQRYVAPHSWWEQNTQHTTTGGSHSTSHHMGMRTADSAQRAPPTTFHCHRHLITTAYHTTGADGPTAAWQQITNAQHRTLHRATTKNCTVISMHAARYCLGHAHRQPVPKTRISLSKSLVEHMEPLLRLPHSSAMSCQCSRDVLLGCCIQTDSKLLSEHDAACMNRQRHTHPTQPRAFELCDKAQLRQADSRLCHLATNHTQNPSQP
jgi:hypothetical protein